MQSTGSEPSAPPALGPPPIATNALTKFFGSHRGIEDLTLTAERGEVLGFLGPNGSGKTTTIRVLMGFLKPSSGQASVLGLDAVRQDLEIRRRVGYLPGDVALYRERTGRELLAFALQVRGLTQSPRAKFIAHAIEAPMDRPIKKLSRGMRQKVALVLTFAHDPEVLILDEPTSGLDPLAQRTILEILQDEGRREKTVFFSSHVLSEAEQICDRVAILREGRLLKLDRVSNLRREKYKEVTVAYRNAPPSLEELEDVQVIWQQEGRITFRVRGDIRRLLSMLEEFGPEDVSITEPSLEEVFLDYYREAPA